MTGQQLKNSILQMAVQGKLVPQDPNDEPASALLERIRAEKEQLICEGKIKREKNPSIIFRGADNLPYEKIGNNEPVCIADEVPFDIPESWEWVRVQNWTQLYNGRAFKPSDWTETGLPIVRIQNLNNEFAPFNYYDKPVDNDVHLYGGELLFAWSGTPGTSFGAHIWKIGKEAVLNQHIFKLIFNENLLYKPYYMYALNERVGSLIKAAHGSAGLQHVTRGVFESTLIPVPPYAEQQRIVAKVEELLPYIEKYGKAENEASALNTTFPETLKKSILQWAVQGKLVPQDPNDEPASVLLERIRAEKEQLIKEGKIKRDKHESVIFRRDNSYYEKVGGVERCIDAELPFEIPESWEWCRIGISFFLQAGKNIQTSEIKESYFDGAFPCYGGNGIRGYVGYFNHDGDYPIIGRQGALCGNINRATGKFYATEHAICVETFCNVDVSWACLFLAALNLNQYATATAQPGLAVEKINQITIPIPPLAEQRRIVAKINSILPILKAL